MKVVPANSEQKLVCRVVTFIGGIDVIGEIIEAPTDAGWAHLWHPFLLATQQSGQLGLRSLLCEPKDIKCVISGKYAKINMRNVIWINPPTNTLETIYQAARAGLVIPSTQPKVVGLNQ